MPEVTQLDPRDALLLAVAENELKRATIVQMQLGQDTTVRGQMLSKRVRTEVERLESLYEAVRDSATTQPDAAADWLVNDDAPLPPVADAIVRRLRRDLLRELKGELVEPSLDA